MNVLVTGETLLQHCVFFFYFVDREFTLLIIRLGKYHELSTILHWRPSIFSPMLIGALWQVQTLSTDRHKLYIELTEITKAQKTI